MTKMIRLGAIALALLVGGGASSVSAQETKAAPAATAPAPKPALVPLKLQLVLSRYQGDKKISSVPYLLWVTANEPQGTRLRMGVQVPVPTTPGGMNYNLKDVGTNIDCMASTASDTAVYKLYLTVSDSGISMAEKPGATPESRVSLPSYRNFTSTFIILMRDGQAAQYTSATDPVSGEVLKIDATLNVLK